MAPLKTLVSRHSGVHIDRTFRWNGETHLPSAFPDETTRTKTLPGISFCTMKVDLVLPQSVRPAVVGDRADGGGERSLICGTEPFHAALVRTTGSPHVEPLTTAPQRPRTTPVASELGAA